MSITSRPDRPPLAKYGNFGFPYHGLVTDGVLALPNSTTMDFPQPYGGEANLIEHPKASIVTPSPADVAAGREWRKYAILNGVPGGGRSINGQDIAKRGWLYCDANAAWLVSVDFDTKGTTSRTIKVYLDGLFGYFGDANYSMTRRLLLAHEYTPLHYDGSTQTAADNLLARSHYMAHSKTGALTTINVGTTCQPPYLGISCTSPWFGYFSGMDGQPEAILGISGSNFYVSFHDALLLTISGTGSLTPGTIGAGITASISSIATAPQHIHSWNHSDPNDWSDDMECFWTVLPSGAITSRRRIRAGQYVGGETDYMHISITGTWAGTTCSIDSNYELVAPYCAASIVHSNLLQLHRYDLSTDSITLVACDGAFLDISSVYTSEPTAATVAWEPYTGDIVYAPGSDVAFV